MNACERLLKSIFVKLHTGEIQLLARTKLKLKNYILYEEV